MEPEERERMCLKLIYAPGLHAAILLRANPHVVKTTLIISNNRKFIFRFGY
jgi:hypothetical protein